VLKYQEGNFDGIIKGCLPSTGADFPIIHLVSGFNPSEKYENQWEGLSHILWKMKNVPNHQPAIV
jgi:hypothetical protein